MPSSLTHLKTAQATANAATCLMPIPQVALAGQPQIGGFLTVLGDDGLISRCWPKSTHTQPMQTAPVQIVVEAAITKATCAREILGETLAK